MKKPRTLAQLREHPWVDFIDADEEGYWLYLNDGYWSPEMETISLHEPTVARLLEMFYLCKPGSPEDR